MTKALIASDTMAVPAAALDTANTPNNTQAMVAPDSTTRYYPLATLSSRWAFAQHQERLSIDIDHENATGTIVQTLPRR
jgi:hypothetical protein